MSMAGCELRSDIQTRRQEVKSMTRRIQFQCWRVTLATLVLCLSGWGQQNVGYITGTVRDPGGAVVPNAQVVAKNEATGVERPVQTTGAGIYNVPNVQIGTYTVTVGVVGFKTTQHPGIHVVAGLGTTVDFSLELGAVSQRVEVTAQAAPV